MKIAAVIFDLNGTILDDERVYDIAFNNVLASLGVDTSVPIPHERGIGVRENWTKYRAKYNFKTDKTDEELALLTQTEYIKQLGSITLQPGFEDFLGRLKDSGVRTGLATSNTWEVTMKVLEKVNLIDAFESITTTEEVTLNKPAPDIFLVAADKLGVEGYECLVIEDAESGVAAAHAAGMKVIAIVSDGHFERVSKADLVVERFSEITPEVIDQL
ncbi:MAG TPA: HAD family phosphatase [Patescibacteria group bacterium]|nr:HAD family phosphatase [Patescibacteria group bacterium]